MRRFVFLALLVLALGTTAASAQSRDMGFGVRAGSYFDPSDAFAGFEANFPITGGLAFNPSFEGIFGDDDTLLALHADVNYMFAMGDTTSAFAGAGFSGILEDSDWESGVNVHGGVGTTMGTLWPYVQARLILGDDDNTTSLGLGLRF